MGVAIEIVLPVFGLVLLGYGAVRAGWFNQAATEGLSLFVFNFAIPIMLLRSIARVEIPAELEWAFLLSYYGASLTVFTTGAAIAIFVFRRRVDEAGIFGFGAAFSNLVMLGIPMALTAFGDAAALPLFMIVGTQSLLLFPLVTLVIEGARGEGSGLRSILAATAGGLVRNPIVLGLLAGFALNLLGLSLPGPLDRMASLLAAAALPCALFAMGAALTAFTVSGQVPQAMVTVALKTLAHPLIAFTLARLFGLDPLWTGVVVLLAAMPTGVNAYLFAQRYQVAIQSAATAVLVSTGVSIVTISVLLYLLEAGGAGG